MTTSRTWESAEAVQAWQQGAAQRARTVGEATERMLDAVGLKEGMRVLDIAAGTGDQSLLAAQRVGPSGSVFATDISASMLAIADQAARDAGLRNIETLAADATTLQLSDESFDAAICRFGLMFMPDVQEVLTRVRSALKPSARLAALVWSTEERNPWMATPLGIVREMGRLPSPPPSIARATSLSAPGQLESELTKAGFHDVHTSMVATPREFDSLDDAVRAMRTTSPGQRELLRDMNDAEREQFQAEVERRLSAFFDGTRCVVPGEAILGVGTK
jgi:SAM-dependent methyltransferase